ncbi:lysophospholipid acyltransferase family protein [uncultured Polaribacter sp.]|uniref:lysophospholipid acyltransferase family protein n=1 Tax=uncultured Polaribacter sp. TaxID=174711 RepID=UPI002637C9FD|nr:lysophospholipid acyltransferase family protein [uncultured Polaribacter sp.]
MRISQLWFLMVKTFVKIGLFFFTKKTIVIGKENIPKKGAVLFTVNHPNGLVDPLFLATNNARINYFLVRAASFKKPFIDKILRSLNMLPIYRIRDGIDQLANNQEIFEKCYQILNNQDTLVIFPEGGHCKDRNVKPLKKGFTRIIIGALEKFPDLNIQIIPVGLTYQNPAIYPSKVCIKYGKPIDTRIVFENNSPAKTINILKSEVAKQLENLIVNIPNNENYNLIVTKLNDARVDYTKVDFTKKMIKENTIPNQKKKPINFVKPLYYLIVINSFLPWLLWKKVFKKIDEIEFIDTFRFAINFGTFPIYYLLKTLLVSYFFGWSYALTYLIISLIVVLIYTKFSIDGDKIDDHIFAGKNA